MKRKIILSIIILIFALSVADVSNAESIPISKSRASVEEGGSFTATVSGINGRVTISGSNCSVSPSGIVWVEGSLTVTGSNCTGSKATISVSPVNVSTSGAAPVKVDKGASASVIVTKKQVQQTQPQQTETKPQSSSNNTKSTSSNNNKNNNNKKNDNNKKENKVEEQTQNETQEEEKAPESTFNEATYNLTDMKFYAVNEKGEETEVQPDKAFDPNTFDYTVNVRKDALRMKITYDSHGYDVEPTTPGDLQDGENTFTYTLKYEGQPDKTYTIKVIKEEPKAEEENSEKGKVSLKVSVLVLIIIVSVAVGVLGTLGVEKIIKVKRNKKSKYEEID